MYKLIEISYEDYCTLGEAGAWVNWAFPTYDNDIELLEQPSMKHFVDRQRKLRDDVQYKFFTRVNDEE